MPKLPRTPDIKKIEETPPEVVVLEKGSRIFRIYKRGGRGKSSWGGFRYYGPTGNRFDHHESDEGNNSYVQARGILYGALGESAIETCLAEVYQEKRFVDREGNQPALGIFMLDRDVQLLDLTGQFPTRVGASQAINTGTRSSARNWSKAFYKYYATVGKIEGLLYSSSMNGNEPCVALYEQAQTAIPDDPTFNRLLCDPDLEEILLPIAKKLGYEMG
ncbi:RES family NAD+ phosphorylase [Microbulbifer epialgicus]|uniref:RES family NAD+ phosphorylase n=1 Tax=Microbulbifer epialgicus TaxID=393907 RepID=A0ABV4NV29_9GAMM